MRETARGAQQELCLKLICFQAVREHLASAAVSIKAVLGECGYIFSFSYLLNVNLPG